MPPNKRKRAEELLGRSKINVTWGNAPSAKEIAEKDQERLLAMPILDELATAEDLELGRLLLDGRTAEQVAAALIRMHRAGLPVPENLKDLGRPAGAAAQGAERAQHQYPKKERDRPAREIGWQARPDHSRSADAPDPDKPSYDKPAYQKSGYHKREDAPRAARPDRVGSSFERKGRKEAGDMVWFGLDIGRDKNADPRWLLPLICRVGEVSKSEIGSIRISEGESRFEIQAGHADRFAAAVEASNNKEGKIWRLDGPQAAAAPARRAPATSEPKPARPAAAAKPEPAAQAATPSSSPSGDKGYVKRKHPAAPAYAKRDYTPPGRTEKPAASTAPGNGYLKRKPAHAGTGTGVGDVKPEHARPERTDATGKTPFHAQNRFKPDARKPRHEGTLRSGKPTGKPGGSHGGKPGSERGGFRAFKPGGKAKRHP